MISLCTVYIADSCCAPALVMWIKMNGKASVRNPITSFRFSQHIHATEYRFKATILDFCFGFELIQTLNPPLAFTFQADSQHAHSGEGGAN